ncbi:hypothetical protein P43SY_003489 [Pythium insidiosum]|uniref:WW domain-containing protein n=1 Tax=Pythium insidiosum TaxID=114742 RepID=A0AAD5M7K0_PYTIN|nr:hypothetical protein P43SY_003489 [Pythium insidiosum]
MSAEMASDTGAADGHAVEEAAVASQSAQSPLSNGGSLASDSHAEPTISVSSTLRSPSEQLLIARGRDLLTAYQRKKLEQYAMLKEMCFSSTARQEPIVVDIGLPVAPLTNGSSRGASGIERSPGVLAATRATRDPTDSDDDASAADSTSVIDSMPKPPSALQRELDDAKAHILELNNQLSESRAQWNDHMQVAPRSELIVKDHGALSNGRRLERDEERRLRDQLQEKDELIQSLRDSLERVVSDETKLQQQLQRARAEIERLESEKSQVEKAASDKRTLLQRAYAVKAKQLDQLCRSFDLPPSWERVTDENGIIYFRRNDRACAPELEDPRVSSVLEHIAKTAGPPSPRSAAGRMENNVTSPVVSATRKRGSWSSSSFDSTVSCDDIPVPPPDDGVPHHVEDFETPLPEGWEMRVTTGGSVFFVNRNTNVTTWRDPRKIKRSSSTAEKEKRRSAAVASLRVDIPRDPTGVDDLRRRSLSVGDIAKPGARMESTAHHEGYPRLQRFDVVFEERGPIGIHFQANHPDAGATVRRLLPRMAAARSEQIDVFDRLVAVNQHEVASAPFRHVMLLLQGGLRPLTLTFERGTRKTRRVSSADDDVSRRMLRLSHSQSPSDGVVEADARPSLGEDDLGRGGRRSSAASNDSDASSVSSSSAASSIRDEDLTIADRIITNVFSLFWTPPEHLGSQVQTV